ncbi:hypothetical protein CR513_26100, partial [Mucuna pruriens]
MATFLSRLNKDIQDIIELHDYTSIFMLFHQASKLQLEGKDKNILTWDKSPRKRNAPVKGHRQKCPNKRTMILKDNGNVESDSSRDDVSDNDGYSSEDTPCEGDVLMVQHLMSAFIEDDTHKMNIFHSRCMVKGSCCSFIIDGLSSVNVASLQLVEKLCLPTIPHPKPYKWLNAKGEMMVDKQVLIELTLGKYKDEILCDVVSMEVTHILLERSWQFDKKVIYDGVTNNFSLRKGRKVTLKPLSPCEVLDDQIKMKKKER